jgi:hypothetical protein
MMLRFGGATAVFAAAAAIAGCSSAPFNLQEGQPCVRSTQCAAGLICNMRRCTADLTGFGIGIVPSLDGGADAPMMLDAPLDDAPMDDAPMTPVDAPMPPPMDAPIVMPDAPVEPPDAPVEPPDAPVDPPDAP